MKKILSAILLLGFLSATDAQATRLKDLATVEGVRSHPLIGYGLVVGLLASKDANGFLAPLTAAAARVQAGR